MPCQGFTFSEKMWKLAACVDDAEERVGAKKPFDDVAVGAIEVDALDAMRARLASLWNVQPGVEHPEELYVTVRIRLTPARRLAAWTPAASCACCCPSSTRATAASSPHRGTQKATCSSTPG